jgi:cbb3-type cytochrome oxidase subunit 3
MKNTSLKSANQRGAAAVELAMILPVLLLFIFMPLFIGRYFWHYTAAQKAAQDAARYLSTISAQELREEVLAEQAALIARDIALAEIRDLDPGPSEPDVIIMCGDDPCIGVGDMPLPDTVKVTVRMRYFDMLGLIDTGRYGLTINAVSVMNHVGN